jgi:hypothetical protein
MPSSGMLRRVATLMMEATESYDNWYLRNTERHTTTETSNRTALKSSPLHFLHKASVYQRLFDTRFHSK